MRMRVITYIGSFITILFIQPILDVMLKHRLISCNRSQFSDFCTSSEMLILAQEVSVRLSYLSIHYTSSSYLITIYRDLE